MEEDRNATVIMTTHDKEQELRVADQLLVMKDGAIHGTSMV